MSHRLTPARWSLHELLPGPEGPALDSHLSRLEATVAEIEATRAGPSPDIATPELLGLLRSPGGDRPYLHQPGRTAYLWFAEDMYHPAALDLQGGIEDLETTG